MARFRIPRAAASAAAALLPSSSRISAAVPPASVTAAARAGSTVRLVRAAAATSRARAEPAPAMAMRGGRAPQAESSDRASGKSANRARIVTAASAVTAAIAASLSLPEAVGEEAAATHPDATPGAAAAEHVSGKRGAVAARSTDGDGADASEQRQSSPVRSEIHGAREQRSCGRPVVMSEGRACACPDMYIALVLARLSCRLGSLAC